MSALDPKVRDGNTEAEPESVGSAECPHWMSVTLYTPDPRSASGARGRGIQTQVSLLHTTRCPLEDRIPMIVMGRTRSTMIWLWCDSCPAAMRAQVFTLPKVSAKLKLKLTALEGSRVRRVGVAHFGSCRAEDYGEHHLAVLTNLGDIQVVSMPLLKPQVRYSCIRREDVSGIASCVFTKYGQGVCRRGRGPR